jgi:hypothetical protein
MDDVWMDEWTVRGSLKRKKRAIVAMDNRLSPRLAHNASPLGLIPSIHHTKGYHQYYLAQRILATNLISR